MAALLILIVAGLWPAQAQKMGVASPDEYKVYEGVLGLMNQIPVEGPRVAISEVTLNSKCGQAAYPNPTVNGCTFFWIKPDTAESVKQKLTGRWADIEDSTWKDFETKNAASVRLFEPIVTPWKHRLINLGEELPEAWRSPDLTIFLSRVGFNKNKTEAVVYVLVFSYLAVGKTGGQYFLLRTDKTGQWKPSGRVTYFVLGKDQSPQ
jgi:hypothetical protein